jgi:transposase InsO family protein
VRCGFVAEHRGIDLNIEKLCQLVGVSKSSYYHWCSALEQRKLSAKEERNLFLRINKAFIKSRKSYGVPRVWRQLLREGVSCSRRQVGYIMRKNKLISVHCRRKRKFVITTNSSGTHAPAANLLNRKFFAKEPNEKWVGDVTFIRTDEGWLYLATIIDLFSRRVVGYALGEHNDAELACAAFKMAIARRGQPKHLIYHSDRGSVYASKAYKQLLAKNNTTASMSRKGDCWDNAVAESFFHTLKVELVYEQEYKLKISALSSIIDWIENVYNTERMHSSIGYCSPAEFELIHAGSV